MARRVRTGISSSAVPRARRGRREERAAEIAVAIFNAAAKVVGEFGYADASIARITARAGVAHGTFYNYFRSREELFDKLLPALGRDMLAFIRTRTAGMPLGVERDVAGFRAYFDYVATQPEFVRIFVEAQIYAPQAFAEHLRIVIGSYRHFLEVCWEAGAMPSLEHADLEPLAYLLTGARDYIAKRYCPNGDGQVPEAVFEFYRRLLTARAFRTGRRLCKHASTPPGATEIDL